MKLLAMFGLGLTACTSGGDSSDFEESAASMEGIYQVQAYTRNEASCAPGGASVLGDERFAAVFSSELFGQPFASVMSCASPEDCRTKVAAAKAFELFTTEFSFTLTGVEGDALIGRLVTTGFGDGEVCREAELGATTLTLVDQELRLEQAITIAADYPVDAEGFCSTDAAQQAAEGSACSQMEVLTATFVEGL